MSYTDLQSVLNFIYDGEVSVAQEDLNSFLALAENLKVKGLNQETNSEEKQHRQQQNILWNRMARPAPTDHAPVQEKTFHIQNQHEPTSQLAGLSMPLQWKMKYKK